MRQSDRTNTLPPIAAGFARSMREIPGMDADALISALDTEPSVAVRLNRRKPIAEPPLTAAVNSPMKCVRTPLYPGMERVSWCADGYYLPERPVFTLNPLLHAGAFYVQDASSMIHQQVVEKLKATLGDAPLTLLDFCAAPGGKTTAMINALPDGSVVVANEYVPARGKILRENLEKWGYPGVITTGASSTDYAALPEIFDIVAVDAPCSGEGMMRKDADARSQWSPRLVEECAALQRSILTDVVNTLRPGGFLIYSTCTFNLEEDELNSRFIRDELSMEPVAIESLGLEGVDNASPALLPDVEALRFMPHFTRGEGLYISIFRKPGTFTPYLKENPPSAAIRTPKKKQKGKPAKGDGKQATELTDDMRRQLSTWFLPEAAMQFAQNANLVTALPAAAVPLHSSLEKAGVRITGAGLPVAEVKGRDLIPDSRAALSTILRAEAFPRVELSEEDALRFLRRDSFTLPPDTPKGYTLVTYRDIPLGIMKNLGNRANNLLPAAWRIRI